MARAVHACLIMLTIVRCCGGFDMHVYRAACSPACLTLFRPLQGLWHGAGAVMVVSGHYEANADMMPTLRVIDITETDKAAADKATEDAAAFAVEGADDVSPELLRELSSRLSTRRASGVGSVSGGPGPLRRQFSKAS